MDKRHEARRVFGEALREAEAAGLEVIAKESNKVYVHNPATGASRTFSQQPGGARGLQNALSELRRLREGTVPRVGDTAKVGSLDGLIPVRDPEQLTVAQRAYMVWVHANQSAEHEQANVVKARVDGQGKLQLGSRSRYAADYYGVTLENGLSAVHDALFPTMKRWKGGKEACLDYLRLSGNAYYLNATDRHHRRWLIRVEWVDSEGIIVPEPEPPAPRRRITPPAAPQALTTYRCRFVGCEERDFITEESRDTHERDHTTPEHIAQPYPSPPESPVVAEIILPEQQPRTLTGDGDLDAAFFMLADAVKERLSTPAPITATPVVELDLASRLRETVDENARLLARLRDLEEFVLAVEQYVEDGQPMAAISYITQFFSDGHSVVA